MYGGELPLKNEEYANNAPTDAENEAAGAEILNLFGEPIDDTQDRDEAVEITTGEDAQQEGATKSDDSEYATLLTDTLDIDNGEPFDPEIICDDLLAYESADIESSEEEEEADADNGEEEDSLSELNEEEAEENNPDSEEEAPEAVAEEAAVPEEGVKPRRVDSLFDFMEICMFTLAGVFLLMSFFFRYSIVDGGSMMNTLQHQERLLLSSFLYTPECGDIVVVQDKSTVLKDPIVKRIIAVGGQTVKFTRTDVYVDGVKLDEPYVYTGDYVNPFGASDTYRYSVYPSDALLDLVIDSEDGVYYEILVPEGEIFVMGDHRNNSKDSRDIGTLHEDAIIGKAIYRFFPFDKSGKIE